MSVKLIPSQWRENAYRLKDKTCVHDIAAQKMYTWNEMLELVENYRSQLRDLGIGTGQRLALIADASAQWIAMVWACWEEGVCWSPFPSSVPSDRKNTQLKFGEFHAQWEGASVKIVNPSAVRNSADAAYLIFTSGTTGQPKGVLVGWHGIENLWKEQCNIFQLDENSTSVWMLSPSFDASVSDVGVALFSGAQLVVVPQKHWLRYDRWKRDMERFQVTHLDAPPSLLARWEHKPLPSFLKVVIAGGEPTPPSLLKAWSQQVRWVNVYGPTETTVCSSAEVRNVRQLEEGLPTLGTPLSHISYQLVHPEQHTLTNEGELWIGGDCVALEYWKDPVLTQQRFSNDTLRWFKSGDWVRYDGSNWIYCGRMDRQIKRNGQLINLDEIEHVLCQYPGVGQVIVVNKNDILYALHCSACTSEELKFFAQTKLPAWGIPRFRSMTNWPLTPHNKIDRKELEKML